MVRKIPWRREWLPTPVFLPGECQGQRSLMGYSQWRHKESDMTECLTRGELGPHMVPEKNWLYLLSQFFSCSLCGTLPCRALLGHSTKTGPIKVTSGNHTAESKAECSALTFAEHPWHLTCALSPCLLFHPPAAQFCALLDPSPLPHPRGMGGAAPPPSQCSCPLGPGTPYPQGLWAWKQGLHSA